MVSVIFYYSPIPLSLSFKRGCSVLSLDLHVGSWSDFNEVDHIVDIVLHILRYLNQVEDQIVLNDKNGRYFSIDWLKQYSIHNVSDYYSILKKIIRIVRFN